MDTIGFRFWRKIKYIYTCTWEGWRPQSGHRAQPAKHKTNTGHPYWWPKNAGAILLCDLCFNMPFRNGPDGHLGWGLLCLLYLWIVSPKDVKRSGDRMALWTQIGCLRTPRRNIASWCVCHRASRIRRNVFKTCSGVVVIQCPSWRTLGDLWALARSCDGAVGKRGCQGRIFRKWSY